MHNPDLPSQEPPLPAYSARWQLARGQEGMARLPQGSVPGIGAQTLEPDSLNAKSGFEI